MTITAMAWAGFALLLGVMAVLDVREARRDERKHRMRFLLNREDEARRVAAREQAVRAARARLRERAQ
jgi:hypothetical protein